MTSRTSTLLAGTAGFVFIIATQQGMAQDPGTANIFVSAEVEAECLMTTTEMIFAFGIYEGNEKTDDADFSWNCPDGKTLSFTIGAGAGGSDGGTTLFLPPESGSGDPLTYQIVNPDGAAMPAGAVGYQTTSNGGEETSTLTAILAQGQLENGVEPGAFSDTLTFTMSVEASS